MPPKKTLPLSDNNLTIKFTVFADAHIDLNYTQVF